MSSDLTHCLFSQLLGRIAVEAASWSSDCLTLPEEVNQPMRPEDVARFTKGMRERLDRIDQRAGLLPVASENPTPALAPLREALLEMKREWPELMQHDERLVEAVARAIAGEHGCDVDWCDGARKAATAALDAIQAEGVVVVPSPPELDPASVERLHAYARNPATFVKAVKEHRTLYGSNLRQALDAVRRIQSEATLPQEPTA